MGKFNYILCLVVLLISTCSFGQKLTNLRQVAMEVPGDTIALDSLSIIPNSEIFTIDNKVLGQKDYVIDYASSKLVFNKKLIGKQVKLTYRVFPLSFSSSIQHKDLAEVKKKQINSKNPFLFEYTTKSEDIFYLNGLNKSGSISRGVSFGNNQDLAVNSSLNLQLSGKLNDDINILASISDDNIPIQADGNTQQLQEFDKVFIQLFNERWRLTAGDFIMRRPNSHFMNFNKKAQGGSFEIKHYFSKTDDQKKKSVLKSSISAAVSKGKFSRNIINGIEGNQGPYRLKGADNELFIIVLSGTERIFIDGQLLERGQDYDYTIDYNTAELTFTPNRLITKDSRIVAEFQYSDKNYARSVVHYGNEYKSDKLTLNLNIYSEQDAKNQPLQQDLDATQKGILSKIGDSLHLALVPNIDSVEFSSDLVLYKMVDTLGYDSVFVYSTDPDSAVYRLGFSNVGPNNGNYVQVQSTANGKVFEWVQPIGGIPQGEFEPVILLVTPKLRQMITFGGKYEFSKNANVGWEAALTNNDINTFSDKDAGDNMGYALKTFSDNKVPLSDVKDPWKIQLGANYEYVERNFTQIERFRTVEFERDWNIRNVTFNSDQHLVNAYTGIEKKKKADIRYTASILNNINEFEGFNNLINANYLLKGFKFTGRGSYLTTSGINQTEFIRHKGTLTKGVKWIVLGVSEETELNRFKLNQSDTLLSNSFEFMLWKAFIQNADTTVNKFQVSYQQREDRLPNVNVFEAITHAEDIIFSMDLLKNKKHKFRGKVTYRRLDILSPTLTTLQPEENILSRVEYVTKLLKKSISSSTYYEIGSGLEVKKEFSYLEVQPGQGTHAYIGDLDSNGVKDLNEFEIAAFQDEADYIKIFTPTNDYVRTYTNQFNQGLFLRPETVWMGKKGIRKLVARFSNRANYRISRKTSDKNDYYNPFIVDIPDTSLVTQNSSFLNTIFFNRTSTKFGMDFTYQENKDKSLLTSGNESRLKIQRSLKSRWNITRKFTLYLLLSNGVKNNASEFFINRNYQIDIEELEPKLTYQPGVKLRWSVYLNYKEKQNDTIYGGERSIARKIGSEFRYNIASKGSFMANFNFIDISFTESNNGSLTYEMLEGLQEGENMTWGMTYQQSLSNHMQINLNYNGRKSEESPMIHTGGVQVRAFF